jgi:hypothetical protein
MPNAILKQAAVIGAGIGGLAAAKAVAPHFEKVIVFDRDALPDEPAPRSGTPQARHTHNLLAGGCRALESLFPGIELNLVEAGAVRMRSADGIAQVSGGARAADVAAATDPLGLAPVTGSVAAGLTLGGGYGPLIGRFGLALDNLEAAEVVLADGCAVVAKRDSEEELFWTLRGAATSVSSPRCASSCIVCQASARACSFIHSPRPRRSSKAAQRSPGPPRRS